MSIGCEQTFSKKEMISLPNCELSIFMKDHSCYSVLRFLSWVLLTVVKLLVFFLFFENYGCQFVLTYEFERPFWYNSPLFYLSHEELIIELHYTDCDTKHAII